MERTFAMLKPGVLQRALAGEVISRIERKGLKIVAMKLMQISPELAKKQYEEHLGKDFYEPLLKYMTSGPVIAMVLEGETAITTLRRLIGPTNVEQSLPGTIRGDLCVTTRKNIIHASDSPESANREISLFFSQEDFVEYEVPNAPWY